MMIDHVEVTNCQRHKKPPAFLSMPSNSLSSALRQILRYLAIQDTCQPTENGLQGKTSTVSEVVPATPASQSRLVSPDS